MFDLCSEESTSKARFLSYSWVQYAMLVPGNSFSGNWTYASHFRNLPIVAKTSDTLRVIFTIFCTFYYANGKAVLKGH